MSESDAINRKIAELRGQVIEPRHPGDFDGSYIAEKERDGRWVMFPDYLEWQHAGKLLEEMWRPALSRHNNDDQWSVLYWKDIGDGGAVVQSGPSCDEPPDAIRRAWLSWEEQ